MTRPGLEPGPLHPKSYALTTRPPRLPHNVMINLRSGVFNFSEEREREALRESRRLGNEISVLNFRASPKRERLIAAGGYFPITKTGVLVISFRG